MKTIFHQAFNTYKMDIEPRVRDTAMPRVQCSRKLFEIVLSHRRATAAYIQGEGRVVTVEGEAARVLNFDTGRLLCRAVSGYLFRIFPLAWKWWGEVREQDWSRTSRGKGLSSWADPKFLKGRDHVFIYDITVWAGAPDLFYLLILHIQPLSASVFTSV